MEVRGLYNSLTFSPSVLMCSGLGLSSDKKKKKSCEHSWYLADELHLHFTVFLQYYYSALTI